MKATLQTLVALVLFLNHEDWMVPSRSIYFGPNDLIRIYEADDSILGKRIGARVLSPDGTVRIYEMKTLNIGRDPATEIPEWQKQFQTLVGAEIVIPL